MLSHTAFLRGIAIALFVSISISTGATKAAVPAPRINPAVAASAVTVSPGQPEVISSATADLQKKFTLEGFFAGETVARGTIFSKTVGVARSFTASTTGTWDGKVLTVVETYQYASGSEQRIWRFRKISDGLYEAQSDEILKKTKVTIKGRIATFKYQKKIPRPGGKKPIKVTHTEEWAFDRKGVLSSRTQLKKILRVGQEAINFVRIGNETALKAPRF